MPNRSRKKVVARKRRPKKQPQPAPARDENRMAFDLIKRIEEMGATQNGKDPLAVMLGRHDRDPSSGCPGAHHQAKEHRSLVARAVALT